MFIWQPKKIAEKECLSRSVVKEIFYRREKAEIKPTGAIRTGVLGIDEISLKKRHKLFVILKNCWEQILNYFSSPLNCKKEFMI
ncbi:hypothetical protein QUF90_08395 [Desulfococcaceae bacterium HSG9]|nr:hypothetical protein [Desulfococcaceae bacterium HSG9]